MSLMQEAERWPQKVLNILYKLKWSYIDEVRLHKIMLNVPSQPAFLKRSSIVGCKSFEAKVKKFENLLYTVTLAVLSNADCHCLECRLRAMWTISDLWKLQSKSFSRWENCNICQSCESCHIVFLSASFSMTLKRSFMGVHARQQKQSSLNVLLILKCSMITHIGFVLSKLPLLQQMLTDRESFAWNLRSCDPKTEKKSVPYRILSLEHRHLTRWLMKYYKSQN